MWWNDKKIRWYEYASSETSFHRQLASVIEKYIGRNESILELGCGLGYVSALLAEDGYHIKATDIDREAIEEAKRIHKQDIFSILNAEKLDEDTDILLLIYFGRLCENDNFQHYISHTRKRLIYVISEHRGQSSSLRKNNEEPERTMNFLKQIPAIKWQRIEFRARFDQPLLSLSDASAYISAMYGNENKEKYMDFIQNRDGRLWLPNDKHSSVFIIEKGGNQ